jgi:hypothetical protein
MPGHRRDNDPDPTNRITTIPSTGSGGDAHGSTVAGSLGTPGRAAGDQPTRIDDPTASYADATPTVAVDRGAPAQGGAPTTDRTPTIPAAPTPAGPSPTRVGAPAAAPVGPAAGAAATPATRREVVAAQRARYGGISWGSAFFGWLSANGIAVLLLAVLSAAGVAFGLTQNVDTPDEAVNSAGAIGIGGGIALLVLLFLAYLAGGYVAGRMARFDGAKQGVAVWVIGLVVVLLLALAGLVFGSQYNVLSQLDLPRIPIDEGTATTAGITALVAVLVVTLVAAVLGGLLGARYHRKVDRVGYDN